ncbi:hypothetical protein [Streptomyces californicus]|uniref:hypothetical protein n=1 Tax=Streptomyces californicus TaxID=67351 RepID=UPI003797CF03
MPKLLVARVGALLRRVGHRQWAGEGGAGDHLRPVPERRAALWYGEDERPLPERGRLANAYARVLIRMQDAESAVSDTGMQMLRRRTGSVGLVRGRTGWAKTRRNAETGAGPPATEA